MSHARPFNNPAHWHQRAQEARLLAEQLEDLVAKASILGMAEEYDRLALRAAKRLQDQSHRCVDVRREAVEGDAG